MSVLEKIPAKTTSHMYDFEVRNLFVTIRNHE